MSKYSTFKAPSAGRVGSLFALGSRAVPRSQEDSAHGAVYRAECPAVQGFCKH
jgi:hypothetical protein